MNNRDTMESPPLPINATLNQAGDRATLHISCQSDGRVARWMEDKEEGGGWAKQVWLGKLGCLLKLHRDIECQWLHLSMEPNTNTSPLPDILPNPWAYSISDFPQHYKLFSVERKTQRGDPPRKDYYLCGMILFFLCVTLLTISFQVGAISTDLLKNSTPTSTGYLVILKGMLKGPEVHASANIVMLAGHRRISMKSFHCLHTRKVSKGPEDPGCRRRQGSYRVQGVLLSRGGSS